MERDTDSAITVGLDTHVKIPDTVRGVFEADGAVLLDIEQGSCLSLNMLGARIWLLLKEQVRGDQIVEVLRHDFPDVPPEQLKEDYIDFVRQLKAHRLVSLSGPDCTLREQQEARDANRSLTQKRQLF